MVWGCERPELLITETLAWHDRRTEDLQNPNNTTTSLPNRDPTFDSRLIPYPACFIELYNPWVTPYSVRNSNNTAQANGVPSPYFAPSPSEVPGEFYYDPNQSITPEVSLPTGVRLNTLDASTGTTPVWRMIFVKNASGGSPDRAC